MDNLNYDNVNVQYDFTSYVHLQLKKNYDCDNSNNPYNFAFTQK
jgi:hypothetical protein